MQVSIPQELSDSIAMLSALTGAHVDTIVGDALREYMETTGSPMLDMIVGIDGKQPPVPVTFNRKTPPNPKPGDHIPQIPFVP